MCFWGVVRDRVSVVDQYLPVLGLLLLGIVFGAGSLIASKLLAPHQQATAAKVAPYECGIVPENDPPARFPVRFYLVAMIFIIFGLSLLGLSSLRGWLDVGADQATRKGNAGKNVRVDHRAYFCRFIPRTRRIGDRNPHGA